MRVLPQAFSTLLVSGAVLLNLLSPAASSAQTLTLNVTNVTGRDSTRWNLENNPVSQGECNDSTLIEIEFTNLPESTATRLDIWRGTTCNTVAQRDGVAVGCDWLSLGDTPINNPVQTFEFAMSELLNCDAASTTTVGIFFLAADEAMTSAEVTDYGVLTIRYDPVRPAAPTDVSGEAGNTEIPVKWKYDGEELREFCVYYDPDAIVEGDTCGAATSLVAGADVGDAAKAKCGINSTSEGTKLSPGDLGGLDIGKSVPVVVVAVDEAFNKSLASEVTCVARVETDGFCDAYGECESCSVTRVGHQSGTPMAALAALLCFMTLTIRRRRP